MDKDKYLEIIPTSELEDLRGRFEKNKTNTDIGNL